jgi:hypothetical protein
LTIKTGVGAGPRLAAEAAATFGKARLRGLRHPLPRLMKIDY